MTGAVSADEINLEDARTIAEWQMERGVIPSARDWIDGTPEEPPVDPMGHLI
jgi:hypothetical protein